MTVATSVLKSLAREIRDQPNKTLANWRLDNGEDLVNCLVQFCEGAEWIESDDRKLHQSQTQELFDQINRILYQQEKECQRFDSVDRAPSSDEIPVVFGGKYASTAGPRSISESLVAKLALTCPQIYTVSRSEISTAVPLSVKHIAKKRLDHSDGGFEEFKDVLKTVIDDWRQKFSDKTLVIYFTLGQHKGENPFQRNIQAARNFAKALESCKEDLEGGSWRVVLTGTDATKPSDAKDGAMSIDDKVEFAIPTYKIMKYNFVYAMSKIGQYYVVANGISRLLGKASIQQETSRIISRIQEALNESGEDGNYHEGRSMSMKELDELSRHFDSTIEPALKDNLLIAKGISICYTPLHARPWTEQAFIKCNDESQGSPKGYIVQQIVRRLKNAISIEEASLLHFPKQ